MHAVTDGRSVGEVWLVGAGPGDPGLLTVRGREVLANADVVVTDRLAAAVLLGAAPAGAEIIHVGKSPAAPSWTQEEINAVLVDRARAGARVVRLKGGDPYMLGRGSEEAQACAAAGVACTVVPGVTSALAVPACAGIPVTHRGLAQEVAIVSGHLPPGHPESTVDWAALAASRATIVILMGVARLMDIADALLTGGRPEATPVAVIERGATPAQRVLRTTLDALAIDAIAAGVRSPAVIVVGEVAARRDALALEAGPLTGIRVLVARTRPRPGLLARRLRQLGADAVETVVARPAPVEDAGAALVAALPGAGGLLLADADEVAAVVTLLRRAGTDVRALAGLTLVAAREDAAEALDGLGLASVPVAELSTDPLSADPSSTGPAGPAGPTGSSRVLIAGAADPPDAVCSLRRVPLLTDVTAEPDPRIAEELRHGDFDVAVFASSTAARGTAEIYGPLPPDLLIAAMGRRSALACAAAGMRVDIVPTEPGVHPLAAAVADFVVTSRSTGSPGG
ncbi:uroporphyrinogen-III C-methyltransferase [Frankia casuarinae]|nr:uroporphyrinogen-III C-methyltransferase [Frankia casuarinae]KDA44923.1 uroporphyrinogen-III C-methyltransferase [Frankia sp. BMG5.23]KEZ38121.1 uroporphyrinogen-III C-methyltransferase [Frankia sp. CeD]TFE35429.1 uroporphyrinogen-III C-methyltransferase [Frankia sp. B2]